MAEDDLGDRMKEYENLQSGRLSSLLPTFARVDGKCFHRFTRDMVRPYDKRLMNLMISVAKIMAIETNALLTHTSSDEITLLWYSNKYKSKIFLDSRIAKMTSVLASMATLYFNLDLGTHFGPEAPKYSNRLPMFDARVWTVPKKREAANVFLWRDQDATRNSIQMAAQSVYSHNALQNKDSNDLQEMLFQKGINWNDYDSSFKRGTYFQRTITKRKFHTEELEKLPPQHDARTNPDLVYERTDFRKLDMPVFSKVTNKIAVIFSGADPTTGTETL